MENGDHIHHKHRIFLLHGLPKNAICAEIGIFKGDYSRKIMQICHPKMLHLIDRVQHRDLLRNLSGYKGRYIFHNKSFEDTDFPRNFFDWVYLDTDHKLNQTREHLRLCYRIVKVGGLICGDDYNDEYVHRELKIAVNLFLNKYKDRVKLEFIKRSQYVIRKVG